MTETQRSSDRDSLGGVIRGEARCARCPLVSAPGCAFGVKSRASRSAPSRRSSNIKLSLLEAVERDDVSHWPSGIYRRAFIRAYAHAIGLNPDVIVREFLELYPDRDDEIAAAFAAAASMTDNPSSSGGPPTRLRNIVGSAIGSLSRLGRGTVTQPPIVARGTPISAPDEDDIPPLPAAPPPRELRPVDTAEGSPGASHECSGAAA